jgi:hypothetical protein
MKNGSLKGFAIAGALATLAVPTTAFAGKDAAKSKVVKCEGANDCKGKGACKAASHDCKGKNDCKGQSFTKTADAKACEKAGGKAAPKKS